MPGVAETIRRTLVTRLGSFAAETGRHGYDATDERWSVTHQPTITDVPGVAVGHWTDHRARTGVTVLVFPEPNMAAAEIRGADPAAREIGTLACGMSTDSIEACVFSGGSTYGLAAAEGVMRALEDDGRGRETGSAFRIPLVPALVVYDLGVGDGSVRPGLEEGAAAYRAATTDPVAMGLVGAGTGTTVAKWRGFDAAVPGGIGSAATRVGDATMAALVVLNAVGDVVTLEGEVLTGGAPVPPLTPWFAFGPRENTTLVALATDAGVARCDLLRIIVRAHDALGACLRPAHTRYDGDGVIAVSCGYRSADLDALGEAAFVVTGRAIEAAVLASARKDGD
jgi:L-aminopeptidase/D-esterase-like protein